MVINIRDDIAGMGMQTAIESMVRADGVDIQPGPATCPAGQLRVNDSQDDIELCLSCSLPRCVHDTARSLRKRKHRGASPL